MVNMNDTIKIRISKEDLDKINYCKEKLNISKSEVIRLGIDTIYKETQKKEKVKEKIMYIETTERKDIGYFDQTTWTESELMGILINSIPESTPENKEKTAKKLLNQLKENGKLEIGTLYVSKYRIATEKECSDELFKRAEEAKKNENKYGGLFDSLVNSCKNE